MCKKFKNVKAIPHNLEKFRNLRVRPFNFLDSFHFLNGSLAGLVKDLERDGHEFELLQQFRYRDIDGFAHKRLLVRKGVFPYEFVKSVQQLGEQTEFPPRREFYSRLTGSDITQTDYEHGKEVFRVSRCETLLHYMELYMTLDVYLLACVIMNFRNVVYREYMLDITQFLSSPHVAFNMLLLTNMHKQPIELVTDSEMQLMMEGGLRGGVAHVSMRHVATESGNVPEAEQAKSILYTDACNLYG